MFIIRSYKPSDLADCADCFYEGFFKSEIKDKDRVFLKDYTQVMIESSNFTYVAEQDGKVAGYLCGVYEKSFDKRLAKAYAYKRNYGLFIKTTLKTYLRLYPLSDDFRREFDVFFAMVSERKPDTLGQCDCELFALTSRQEYRKGLGTALVNEMVERCRLAEVKTIRLFTNTDVAYAFYERYGFKRIKEIPYSMKGADGKSLIYELTIV